MDEHRKMAEKIYKEINEIRKFANEADESTESNRVWVETYGDITCDDIIPVIIEHALRTTASKSEKDGYRKGVEDSAKIASESDKLEGGCYGGPSSCEYGCGMVISEAIRKIITGETK